MGHDTGSPARSQGELAALLPWARRYVARLGASQNEANDVVQEALLTALQCWETFDPQRGTLRGWLTGILKNQWLDYRGWRRTRREVALSHLSSADTALPSCEGAVMARSTLRFLSTSTQPERWRVVLARAEGSTGFETAKQENVCAGTAYDRARCGRLDLAAALAREDAAAEGPMMRRRPRSKP